MHPLNVLTMLVVASLFAAPSLAADAVSFRLNWYLGGLHVPFYYGKEKGYYAAENIDLIINEAFAHAFVLSVTSPTLVRFFTKTRESIPDRLLELHVGNEFGNVWVQRD